MKLPKIFERNQTPDELVNLLNQSFSTNSGADVNQTTAQGLPAVYCAVNTIAEAIASMPIHVFKKNDEGDKERQRSHIVEKLFNLTPNGYQTSFDFKAAMMRSVLLTGNAYARILYDNAGRIQRLIWLSPNSVIVKELPDYRLGYQITINSKTLNLQQEEVLHIRANSDDGITGKSPIKVCRESIGSELAAQTHGASLFKNRCAPSGAFAWPGKLSAETAKAALDHILKTFKGAANTGKPLILTEGASYTPISMSNQDAEWIESRKMGIAEVARMFKISPIFLQDYSNSTYSNFAEASKAFLQQTLKPWLTNIELALVNKLIPERNQPLVSIAFETKDLLRATAKERFQIYDIGIRNGVMSPNECRKAENLAARDQGDEFSQSWLQQTTAQQGATEQAD